MPSQSQCRVCQRWHQEAGSPCCRRDEEVRQSLLALVGRCGGGCEYWDERLMESAQEILTIFQTYGSVGAPLMREDLQH